jgi:hypothetical protein
MNAQPLTTPPSPDEPSVAGVKVRPVLPLVLYALLVGSALLAFWAQRTDDAPEPLSRFAPWAFLAFAIGFSAYRLALVFAKRYSAFKAFSQILFAALFFMLLLLPQVVQPPPAALAPAALLADRDPKVRALSAEVLGWRGEAGEAAKLVPLLGDPDERVRTAAHGALVKLNGGADLGPEAAKWRERFP